jgi:hypothetical protein
LTKILKGKNNNFWKKVVIVKFKAIYNTNTFKKKITLKLLQKIKRNKLQVHGIQTIITIKTNIKREISHGKVRVVVQSNTMREGVDYDLTFTPMAHMSFIRLLIVITCHNRWKVY